MPRRPRKKSQTGIYHIMLRGINKQTIFEDNVDKKQFFQVLSYFKTTSDFEVYGYCFMDNHVHLLMKENEETISSIIQRISSSYVYCFNKKYERCGHLFQGRFLSEVINNETSLLEVLRYIHQNPVKAGIADKVADIPWLSYHEYLKRPVIVDVETVLNLFSSNRTQAIEMFERFTQEMKSDQFIDFKPYLRLTDSELKGMMKELGVSEINQFHQLEKRQRSKIIKALKQAEGTTIRQISRVTGISKSVISRI